jgi:hypothetical protein
MVSYLLTAFLIFVGCISSLQDHFAQLLSQPLTTVKILFVGNSLTYTNDLPELVRMEAKKRNIFIETSSLALPNAALEDHWNSGEAQKFIKANHFNFVIVQQGPSSQPEGRKMLLGYGEKFRELCKEQKTQLAFFMVWPAKENYHMFDGVIKNYTEAAETNAAILLPVGKVWKKYMDETKDFSYYGPDEFHPSLKGSQVAAKVICETLFPK